MKSKIAEIEQRAGRPIGSVLCELYELYGSQKRVAAHLQVNPSTVSLWLVRVGLKEKTILVPRERTA